LPRSRIENAGVPGAGLAGAGEIAGVKDGDAAGAVPIAEREGTVVADEIAGVDGG